MSAVPAGMCLIHGSFVGPICPTCCTAATIHGLNKFAPVNVSPCFVNCGEPACQKLGCVRVYNAEHREADRG